jgi:hypothetical protein
MPVFFDVETQNSFQEIGGHYPERLRISVVVTHARPRVAGSGPRCRLQPVRFRLPRRYALHRHRLDQAADCGYDGRITKAIGVPRWAECGGVGDFGYRQECGWLASGAVVEGRSHRRNLHLLRARRRCHPACVRIRAAKSLRPVLRPAVSPPARSRCMVEAGCWKLDAG